MRRPTTKQIIDVLGKFLDWHDRASDTPEGADYLNGVGRKDRRDGWDDLADIMKEAEHMRSALRKSK